MTDLLHHHHPHYHDDDKPMAPVDPGGKSLADALRVSFRLLSVIMLVVLVFYMLTGVKSIQSSQVGVKKVFGKLVGVAQPGLAYTWPFPIGGIDVISTKEEELEIDDFWMYETPEQKSQPLLSRQLTYSGLDPGLDGALFTGDRNLLHVRLKCRYRVVNPTSFVSNLAGAGDGNVNEVIRSAICRAAIHAAAARTADSLQRTESAAFALAVRDGAQEELDAIGSGIEVVSVVLPNSTWPLGALRAYIEAQNANREAEQQRSAAQAEAVELLNEAAGASYLKLVGSAAADPNARRPAQQGEYNLISQYAEAVEKGDDAAARDLLDKIDHVLRSSETGGEAAQKIATAEAYRTTIIQQAKARAKQFNELLPAFNETPELMLERLWADVREAVLDSPTIEKYYLTPGSGKTVLKISRDPKVVAEITREETKKDTGK